MSYHQTTKELAITIAILHRKRFEVERDRETYRTKQQYRKVIRILDSTIRHIQERWNRCNQIWEDLMGEILDETPASVNARIRKAREQQKKAIEKNKARSKRLYVHVDESTVLNMSTVRKPKKWRLV